MSRIEEFFEKSVDAGIIPQISMNCDAVSYKIYTGHLENKIDELTAENAKLRARLDKAIELPSRDRVWYIAKDEEGQESYIIPKPTSSLTVEELKYEMDKKYFSTRETAEARLKEIKENAELRTRLNKERAEEMRLCNEERKQAVKEFAERVKMAFYYEFDELIPSIMADKIDEIVKEVCGE